MALVQQVLRTPQAHVGEHTLKVRTYGQQNALVQQVLKTPPFVHIIISSGQQNGQVLEDMPLTHVRTYVHAFQLLVNVRSEAHSFGPF